MCGFGGIYKRSNISKQQILDAAAYVSFRGPDNTGWSLFDENFGEVSDKGSFGVFHNRLSIIDLDQRSNQPYQDKDHLLLFNGEIYNFQDILAELGELGHTFTTESDTEVLFVALKVWGKKAVSKLNGMFAFAFLDKNSGALVISRDRAGIKPLYYSYSSDEFCFASELDTITRLAGPEFQVSSTSISVYRQLGFTGSPDSIWSGISKVKPGTIITIQLNKPDEFEINSYWTAVDNIDRSHCYEGRPLLSTLTAALNSQLIADVPIGMFVSSGVDSSVLAAIANQSDAARDITYFTVKFDLPTAHDESVDARKFLTRLGVKAEQIKQVNVTSKSILDSWLSIYSFLDEPCGDYAVLLNYAISKVAAEHVKVVVTGDGGDEIFGGYERYKHWQHYKRQSYSSLILYPLYGFASFVGLRSVVIRLEKNHLIKYLRTLSPRSISINHWKKLIDSLSITKEVKKFVNKSDFPRIVDFLLYLPDGMLFKVDRASMAVGLEARVPFLDNRIIDMGMSKEMLDAAKPLKWRLKEVLRDLVPYYDFERPKTGFSLPLAQWMRDDWSDVILDLISSDDVNLLGLNRFRLKWEYRKLMRGNDYYAYRLWIDCNLILWFQSKKKL
jgi:asparagine synthase (glutamine-hydrolysing)